LFFIMLPFAILAIASGAARAPWCDEAYFAEPALQINQIGRMATLVNPPSPIDDPRTVGSDRYIFWTLPLDIVLQAAWYRIVGFGMIQMRLLATIWGLAAIAAWWAILAKLGAGRLLRLTATVLISVDYSFVRSGSEGRMDMMSAALGWMGVALFLHFEERGYLRALFFASACAAASAFTHPVGGALAVLAVAVTALWYSRGRLRWWHPAVAAIPFLILGAGWGIYILQAPDLFRRQLLSIGGGRVDAGAHPLLAIQRELSMRWGTVFGLSAGGGGAKRARALVLAAYVVGLLAGFARFPKLKQSGFGIVLIIATMDLALLCFGDSTKSAAYLIHVVPWLGVLLALFLVELRPWQGALVFAAVVSIQLAGSVYIISRLEFQREFLPVVRAIQARGGQVTGEAQLGFGLGFNTDLVDDRRLGYYSGKKPRLVAVSGTYEAFFETYRRSNPALYAFIQAKLARSELVFKNSLYSLYLDPDPR
jgi:hypothetical protein